MKLPERLNKKAPFQAEPYHHGGYITFVAHLRAYAIYSAIYGNQQTAERLAERGGFGQEELDFFYPEWRNHIITKVKPK